MRRFRIGTPRSRQGRWRERRDVAQRLEALPEAERSRLGRSKDAHAAQRARLTAAITAADQQIAALDTHAQRIEHTLGKPRAIREEQAGLERRVSELEHESRQLRDELAEHIVASRPAWARELFGTPRAVQARRALGPWRPRGRALPHRTPRGN